MRLPGGAAEAFAAELEIAAAGQRSHAAPDLAVAERLASATGHRLSIKLLPGRALRWPFERSLPHSMSGAP